MPQVRTDPSKWARNAAGAGQDYKQGVSNPRTPWAAAATASESAYEAGVQASIARKSYSKGVGAAGDAKWKQGVDEKGQQRYMSGVATGSAQTRYQAGFSPYAAAIQGVTLAPRGPKGQNYGRVQQIGDALVAAKQTRV